MRFNVENDSGEVVNGWIILDNISVTPRLVVRVSGHEEREFEVGVNRFDLRDSGLHTTGRCGFFLSSQELPGVVAPDRIEVFEGLERAENVEIFEAESKLCIYRRFSPETNIAKRVFLFDAGALPQKQIFGNVSRHFASRYGNFEQYSLETATSIIYHRANKSTLIMGRPKLMKVWGHMRESEFLAVVLLRNPFEELAERLLLLNLAGKMSQGSSLSGFLTGLEPALDFAAELPIGNPRALNAKFRAIAQHHRMALANPMTRMLTQQDDERIERAHVSQALDNLSQLDVVGTRDRYLEVGQILKDMIGVDLFGDAVFETFKAVPALKEELSRSSAVVSLLEHDLALYSYAEEAVEAGLVA